MSVVSEALLVPIRALIMVTALSIVYKRNLGFVALENGMVGAIVGITVAQQWQSITQSIIPKLNAGDLSVLFPMIYGLAFISVLSRRTRYINRLVTVIMLTVTLGVSLPQQYYNIYLISLGYTRWTDPSRIAMSILFICAVTFFIFGRKASRPLRIPMVIGSYAIYTYCALMTSSVVFLGADNIIGIGYDMVRNPLAAATLLIIPIYIIVDRMRQGKPILSMASSKASS
jgi:hypothetical protein